MPRPSRRRRPPGVCCTSNTHRRCTSRPSSCCASHDHEMTGGSLMGSSPPANFGLAQIGQIAVPVADVERAIAFYRDVLGMRFLFQAPPGLGFFDCGGVRLMLDAPAKAQAKNYGSVIYYRVPDLQAAFETLRARGVAFEGNP